MSRNLNKYKQMPSVYPPPHGCTSPFFICSGWASCQLPARGHSQSKDRALCYSSGPGLVLQTSERAATELIDLRVLPSLIYSLAVQRPVPLESSLRIRVSFSSKAPVNVLIKQHLKKFKVIETIIQMLDVVVNKFLEGRFSMQQSKY